MKIRDLMTTDVRAVPPDATIKDAANIMNTVDVGAVPVVDNNKLVGIVTDRDIVVRSVAKGQDPNQKICDVMTKDIKAISPDTEVHEAADIMAKRQIRRLPVVDNGNLVGIVSIGDLAVEGKYEDEAGEALHDISKDTLS
ncbi:CBS domain-containing protein [Lutispora thermophila]|uniref:CBS domain-containing protein n=1 Tax=Lutispora thermophila DSM 19022 TaxID=1122184 RepID=A0A1M6CIN4_9FIRM|nr:CBS domain-containing protein [Lutispora thermophila]SHI60721.1 CBS domain-containing protein [Lutispora thermophila DSM 19022]